VVVATWYIPRKVTVSYQLRKKRDFSETFIFSEITFRKKKTLRSLENYST